MEDNQYIITIQRQFGSMGRQIAKRMSELLNIEYYDRDIVDKTSREFALNKSIISSMEEKIYNKMSYPLGKNNQDIQDHIFNMQECIITEIQLAGKPCIIVGRCADYILRNKKNVFNFFIYAPYEERLKNCTAYLGLKPNEAKELIESVDGARMNYHKRYTGLPSDTVEYRQLLVDSSFLGVEGTAQLLVDIIKKKMNI